MALATGDKASSEPETQALCQLIDELRLAWIVSFHEPLACIEQAPASPRWRTIWRRRPTCLW